MEDNYKFFGYSMLIIIVMTLIVLVVMRFISKSNMKKMAEINPADQSDLDPDKYEYVGGGFDPNNFGKLF